LPPTANGNPVRSSRYSARTEPVQPFSNFIVLRPSWWWRSLV
jgi:hypothetical protein